MQEMINIEHLFPLEIPQGILAPLKLDDMHMGHVKGLNDPEVNRFLVTARENEQTDKTVREFIEGNLLADDAVLLGIWIDGQSLYCGTVRLHQIDRKEGTAILGLCIFDKQAWGRSVGTEAIRAVTRWAMNVLKLDKILASAYIDNVASWSAFVKAGFSVVEDVNEGYFLDGKPATVRRLAAHNR